MTDLPSPRIEVWNSTRETWVVLRTPDLITLEQMVDYVVDERDNHAEFFRSHPSRVREEREGSSHKVYPPPAGHPITDKSPFEGGWNPLLLHGMV